MQEPRRNEERARIDALANQIAEAAAHIDAATHRLLTQIREFDEAFGWYRQGAVSCAQWLSWRIGLSRGAAREKVRVAKALGELPGIDEALSKGEISYSKVRAMTRVATPDNEELLLEMAHASTGAQLEKICRLTRGVQQAAAGEGTRDVDDRRWVSTQRTDDGMIRLTAQFTVDEVEIEMRRSATPSRAPRRAGGVEPPRRAPRPTSSALLASTPIDRAIIVANRRISISPPDGRHRRGRRRRLRGSG